LLPRRFEEGGIVTVYELIGELTSYSPDCIVNVNVITEHENYESLEIEHLTQPYYEHKYVYIRAVD
jgi:hypothetical protein